MKAQESERTNAHTCWHCGTANTAVSAIEDGAAPVTGDLTVCAECLYPGIFVVVFGRLAVRQAEEGELARLAAGNESIAKTLDVAAGIRATRERP